MSHTRTKRNILTLRYDIIEGHVRNCNSLHDSRYNHLSQSYVILRIMLRIDVKHYAIVHMILVRIVLSVFSNQLVIDVKLMILMAAIVKRVLQEQRQIVLVVVVVVVVVERPLFLQLPLVQMHRMILVHCHLVGNYRELRMNVCFLLIISTSEQHG